MKFNSSNSNNSGINSFAKKGASVGSNGNNLMKISESGFTNQQL